MTTHAEIRKWFDDGVKQKRTHLLIVCDEFDYEDYPVYVTKHEDVTRVYNAYENSENMQHVMEVYNLSKPFNKQLTVCGRVWNF